jgi:hypothetical protein
VTEIAGPETTPDGLRFAFAGRDNLTPVTELQFVWRVDGSALVGVLDGHRRDAPGLPAGST